VTTRIRDVEQLPPDTVSAPLSAFDEVRQVGRQAGMLPMLARGIAMSLH